MHKNNLKMKNIQENTRLVDDNSELNDSKINISNFSEEVTLIFRNQLSKNLVYC